MRSNLLAYVPALHRGYLEFFERHRDGKLYLLGDGFRQRFTSLERDVRAVSAAIMVDVIRSLKIFKSVEIIEPLRWKYFIDDHFRLRITAPDEDEMHTLLDGLDRLAEVEVRYESTFLRWSRGKVLSQVPVEASRVIGREEFHREFLDMAYREAAKSGDFWRQVGAVAVRSGKPLFTAHNRHVPNDRALYTDGDPRSSFDWGEYVEYSTACHAEPAILAAAANQGVPLKGAQLYVTTFPCRPCANALFFTGFTHIYFCEGYSNLESVDVLKRAGIEIVQVQLD